MRVNDFLFRSMAVEMLPTWVMTVQIRLICLVFPSDSKRAIKPFCGSDIKSFQNVRPMYNSVGGEHQLGSNETRTRESLLSLAPTNGPTTTIKTNLLPGL